MGHDVVNALTAAGASCVTDSDHFGAGSQTTGVLSTDGSETSLYGVASTSAGTWTCAYGCVDGCTAGIEAHDIDADQFAACRDLAVAACAP